MCSLVQMSSVRFSSRGRWPEFIQLCFMLFNRYWKQEVQQAAKDLCAPKLSRVLIQCYWKSYLLIGIYIFIEVKCSLTLDPLIYTEQSSAFTHLFHVPFFYQEVIKVIQPLLLGKLIEYFEVNDGTDTSAVSEAYSYAAGISLTAIVLAVLHHLYFYHVQREGMKIRVAMCHMIYRKVSHFGASVLWLKVIPPLYCIVSGWPGLTLCSAKALRLNNTALAQTTTGQIVNLLSNDVNKFDEVIIWKIYVLNRNAGCPSGVFSSSSFSYR